MPDMIRLIKIVVVAALALAARGAFAEDPQLCMVGESTTSECKGDRLAPMAKTFNAVSPDGLNEVRLEIGEKGMKYSVWRRGKAGCKTTFYVCCTAAHPNTFMDSPLDEGFWLGAYPVMVGFDGFLRWAANSWPKDPYDDASFKTIRKGNLHWRPGDTFFVYPGGELSSRMIALRAGVVAAEKMRILREAGVDIAWKSAALAAKYGYKGACANNIDFSVFRREVEALVNATAASEGK